MTKLVRFCFLNTKHVLNNEALTIRNSFVFSNDSSTNPTTSYIINLVMDSVIEHPKNDRCRAQRDSIARAPRGKKKGGTTRSCQVPIESAHFRVHAILCNHQVPTHLAQHLHPFWITQQRVLNILCHTPLLLSHADLHFS